MREISPAFGISADEFLSMAPTESRSLVETIRKQKTTNLRPKPSSSLVDRSTILTPEIRRSLLDAVASLVDENLFGRSEMCIQFSSLLHLALTEFGVDSRVAVGKAIYFDGSTGIFRWDHAWVRIASEVVDGNTDILHENPMVPDSVHAFPYWGSITDVPSGRRLREANGSSVPHDEDIQNIWWPELREIIRCLK